MKKLINSAKIKMIACILLVVSVIICTVSAAASLFILNEHYGDNKFTADYESYYRSQIFNRTANDAAEDIFQTIAEDMLQLKRMSIPERILKEKYPTGSTNLYYSIRVSGLNNYYESYSCSNYSNDMSRRFLFYETIDLDLDELYDEYSVSIILFFPEELTVKDSFLRTYQIYVFTYYARYVFFSAFIVTLLTSLISSVYLVCAAGHRKSHDGITLNFYDKLPLELTLIFALLPLIFRHYGIAISIILFVVFLQTLSARIKFGKWYKNTLSLKAYEIVLQTFSCLPTIWKAVLSGAVFFAINILLILLYTISKGFILWPILLIGFDLLACVMFFRLAMNLHQIKKMTESISSGDFEHKLDTKRMTLEFKDIAENLNSASLASMQAIEAARKSERMKAELITNVSHDIKTPLTSIINYVDLLKKEDIPDERVRDYIEVLSRQSARLKKLTADLIDASKAATGNIDINFTVINICEFINQATGEYSERLAANRLTPILTVPDKPIYIRADGDLLWRVIDNLLGNACKYSQADTRVYVSVEGRGSEAVISVKNISRDILNISADELTERFVRGDSSRNSEGSGLGLSIAKSLTALQNGRLNLEIDCDLFKAEVFFPETSAPNEEG